MREGLLDIICCPNCYQKIILQNETLLYCNTCGSGYEIKNDVPILLSKTREKELFRAIDNWKSLEIIPPLPWWLIKPIISPLPIKWGGEGLLVKKIIEQVGENGDILDIGCGAKVFDRRIISLDIVPSPQATIVADARELPFLPETIDAVIIFRVIEHVDNPFQVVNQIRRVLKKGGKVFAIIPFLEPFHLNPTDNLRFCKDGIINLFSGFECKKLEIIAGPGTTLLWVLKEYIATLFPFSNNKLIYVSVRELMGWLFYPIKITDIFLKNKTYAHKIACEFLYIGEKKR